MLKSEVRQLFGDYVFFRDQTHHYKGIKKRYPFIKDLKPTQERLALLEEMADWCKEKDIPSRQWLYSLFAIRAWNFAPSLSRAHLLSKKHLQRYKTHVDYEFYTNYIRSLENRKSASNLKASYDPNRDVSATTEQAKQYYLKVGGPNECRKFMNTETFGYHPVSRVCLACPGSVDCLSELQGRTAFDVLALRTGQLTVQEAQRQAFAR